MSELRVKSTGTIKLFENDNTSSVTIASPASLGADRTITLPDGDVTLVAGTMSTGGVTLSGSTNNQVTTVTGADAIAGETNLTYNGTILGCGATGASADLGTGIHIRVSDTGGTADANSDDLVIESAVHNGMTILTNNDQESAIEFRDSDGAAGSILYKHSDNALCFGANNAEASRFNSSGSLLIGTASTLASAAATTPLQVTEGTGGQWSFVLDPSASSPAPQGMVIYYSGVGTDAGSHFYDAQDTGGRRFLVLGTGNVQNANNSYGSLSDERLKENIVDANSQWEDVKKLKFKNFKKKGSATIQLGVVAQDLETDGMTGLVEEDDPTNHDIRNNEVFGTIYTADDPETQDAVLFTADDQEVKDGDKSIGDVKIPSTKQVGDIKTTTGEKVKGVKYSVLLLKSAKALQEAMEKIETLESKVTALENK